MSNIEPRSGARRLEMGKTLEELEQELLQDPEIAEHYRQQAPMYELAHELISARKRAGLTQAEVADRMHTSQPAVARMESGKQMPTWKTLYRYAEATGSRSYVMAIMDYDEEGELQVAFSTAGTRMDILYCAEVIKANYGPGRGGD